MAKYFPAVIILCKFHASKIIIHVYMRIFALPTTFNGTQFRAQCSDAKEAAAFNGRMSLSSRVLLTMHFHFRTLFFPIFKKHVAYKREGGQLKHCQNNILFREVFFPYKKGKKMNLVLIDTNILLFNSICKYL